jgi:hypothetical protein
MARNSGDIKAKVKGVRGSVAVGHGARQTSIGGDGEPPEPGGDWWSRAGVIAAAVGALAAVAGVIVVLL